MNIVFLISVMVFVLSFVPMLAGDINSAIYVVLTAIYVRMMEK